MLAARLTMLGLMSPFIIKGAYSYYTFKEQYDLYKFKNKKPMNIYCSDDFKDSRGNVKTTALNNFVLQAGIKDTIATYKPAWFYFHSLVGQVVGSLISPGYKVDYERVILKNDEEGDIALDVVTSADNLNSEAKAAQKVVICLHGVSGSSGESYMKEISGMGRERGYNVICFNHYGPPNTKDYRMMDMSNNCYIDEVIQYAKQRFDTKEHDSEIYLVGFSLGGNHSLRYLGNAHKQKLHNQRFSDKNPHIPDLSDEVRAVVAISNPYDLFATSIKMRKTHFGLYDFVVGCSMKRSFKNYTFKD